MRLFVGVFCVLFPALALAGEFPAAADIPVAKINHEALEKLGWKLSCQAYTFRELTCFETLDVLHALGVRYIELYPGQKLSKDSGGKVDHHMSAADLELLKKKLADTGITPVNYGVVGLGKDEKSAREVFDFAAKLGLLTIDAEPGEDTVEMLDRLTAEYKINIAIHDHPKPSRYWNPDFVLKVSAGRSARIGSCADTGHWYRSGLVPVDCLKKLEGRIISLHFKDLSAEKKDAPWGTGVCDAKGMLAEIRRQKLTPVFSIEYESTTGKELVDNVRKCCEFLSNAAEGYAAEGK